MVLVVKALHWNSFDGRMWVISLKCCVRNERANVFLQLSQVLHNVVLREFEPVLVALLRRHGKEELASLEHDHHAFNVDLNLLEHLLSVFGFGGTTQRRRHIM